MSIVAEYATELHKKEPKIILQGNTPYTMPHKNNIEKLKNIEAAIFDIYGTIINYCPTISRLKDEKNEYQLNVFLKTAQEFGFTKTLKKIDNTLPPNITLANFYTGLLLMLSERGEVNKKKFYEPQVFEIWNLILSILCRNGYEIGKYIIGEREDFAKCIAYFFHFYSFGRSSIFENCANRLFELKRKGVKLGLLANTQFYTTMELSLYLREDEVCDDYKDLFDNDLCFFSYDFKMTKQSGVLHQKLFDTLYDLQILPQNTLFVSQNIEDLVQANELGFKTALFGENKLQNNNFIPDVSFKNYSVL
ncbi:MAG: hypothetical protein LBH98_02580 [Chitinispirillales bacterium]|nr:hypothetical protein [Chitinispirillales bacterium]